MFVWCDVETTGLRRVDTLLEVGVLVTDDQLLESAAVSVIVEPPRGARLRLEGREKSAAMRIPAVWRAMDSDVIDMHRRSGLTAEIAAGGGHRLGDAESRLREFLDGVDLPGFHPMCGSSVSFDRQMLERWMPSVARWFHYRTVDVSTLRELARRWRPEVVPEKQLAHRVLADLRESAGQLRSLVDAGFVVPSEEVWPWA